ncbi:MAG: tRNA (adenosine(37)-N6)-dimethylallyltransferase MiaA [Pleurocapsa minor GSE-CHR-MK-17-07R]|nr:tRNA (adenosine(37)-N6)-dimethylallyltransferase MiaA [Pleurocapsa minor GSE-CHR-MK 17-07R]
MPSTGEKIPLLVIFGPTAVGKTRLAIDLAQQFDGDIIGADSRQIYRYMDIGTAKPSPDELAAAPHHLISIVTPDQTLTAAEYARMARHTIESVYARGRLPMLVGGTGQYVTSVVEGWNSPAVPPDPALRAELEAFAAANGPSALHDRLTALDPDAAAKIDAPNIRRVVRALEVCLVTGGRFSQLTTSTPPPYDIRMVALTMPREALFIRADQRIDAMMRAGFADEVRALLAMGYDRKLPAMTALGYDQLAAHLLDSVPLETAIAETKRGTRAFIRRQDTWFRRYKDAAMWYNSTEPEVNVTIALNVKTWLYERTGTSD